MIDKECDHVIAPEKPDEFLQELWDLNDKYPDFIHAVKFDHVSSPEHDMDECKKIFMKKITSSLELALKDITLKIEEAEEDGQDELRKQLLAQRKQLKTLSSIDLSLVKSIDDLISLKPAQLQQFWEK